MSAQQQIIFKADDIRQASRDELSPGWVRFITCIRETDTTAALGLIGDSLENPSDTYLDQLNRLVTDERFELWNHGYDHHLKRTGKNGDTYSEFHNTSLGQQCDHLEKTQLLAKDRLGLTLTTFGAPGNHIDKNTTKAVDAAPDITIWLYGSPGSRKRILKRTINVEHPVHHPDFEAFRSSYTNDIPVMTLQLHPSGWDDERFKEFRSIVSFLKDQDCAFANPVEFVEGTKL